MNDPFSSTVRLIPPGAGRSVHAFGAELIFHLTGEQTEGRLTVATTFQPPGGGPPPHYHENEDETFLVQEGRFSFLANGEWREAGAGAIIFAPRKSVHTFRNVGDTPGRVLIYAAPSGFETFFTRCAEEFAKPGGPDMARIFAISAEHGIHYVEA